MQRAMEVVELSDMQGGEVEVMTVEMQQLGAMTSRWSQKRRMVAQEKTNRRFVQDTAKVDLTEKSASTAGNCKKSCRT